METFQIILVTGILLIGFMISISVLVSSIQTIINTHHDEVRRRQAALRDEEYHYKRMEAYNKIEH